MTSGDLSCETHRKAKHIFLSIKHSTLYPSHLEPSTEAKMCGVIEWTYRDCGHVRKREVQADKKCEWYNDEARRCDSEEIYVVYSNRVAAPLLCPDCFRECEQDIDDTCNARIALLQERKDIVDQCRQSEEEEQKRDDMSRRIDHFQSDIEKCSIIRKETLAEFRSRQGVWGDG